MYWGQERDWQHWTSQGIAAFGHVDFSFIPFAGRAIANSSLEKLRAHFGCMGRAKSHQGRAKPIVLEA